MKPEEPQADSRELVVERAPVSRTVDHVGDDFDTAARLPAREHLDEAVGIRDGGGLVADHDDYVMRGFVERHNAVAQTRRRVDQQEIERLENFAERLNQPGVLRFLQCRHVEAAGARRHHAQTTWRREDHVLERAFALDHVLEIHARSHAEQHVDVCQTKIGVEQHGVATELRERRAEIDGDHRLSDSAFAARHGHDLDGPRPS